MAKKKSLTSLSENRDVWVFRGTFQIQAVILAYFSFENLSTKIKAATCQGLSVMALAGVFLQGTLETTVMFTCGQGN